MFIKRILDNEKNSTIKVIGVGSAGNIIVRKLYEDNTLYHTINITTSLSDAYSAPDTKLVIGLKTCNRLSCRFDMLIGKKCFRESKDEIESIIRGHDTKKIVLVSGLGGGLASSILPVLAKLSYDLKMKVVVVVSLPFSFDGKKVDENAQKCITELNKLKDKNIIDRLLIIDSNNEVNPIYELVEKFKELDRIMVNLVKKTLK